MIAHTSGSGRPLIAIHGFGVDHRILLPLESVAGVDAWRRIYLDLPWAAGGVASDAGTTQQIADRVVAEIRAIVGDEPFAIIGNSYGGMISRYVAHEMREQVLGLATIAGVTVSARSQRNLPAREVIVNDESVLASAGDMREYFADVSVVQTPEALADFLTYVMPGVLGADETIMNRVARSYGLDVEPEIAHPEPFTAPSLHMFGRQDDGVGYEDGLALRDHYTRATYAVLDAAGHNTHIERSSLGSALIADWLQRMS